MHFDCVRSRKVRGWLWCLSRCALAVVPSELRTLPIAAPSAVFGRVGVLLLWRGWIALLPGCGCVESLSPRCSSRIGHREVLWRVLPTHARSGRDPAKRSSYPHILRRDPAMIFPQMPYAERDLDLPNDLVEDAPTDLEHYASIG